MPPIINAIATDGTNVYVAGQFNFIGGVDALNVARWDGSQWHPLGAGVGNAFTSVSALALMGSNLYVGGTFTNAGPVAASNIACWDGTHWRDVGGGVDATVFALAVGGSDLYAGGSFGTAGGPQNNANAVARWDGSHWHPLSGLSGNGAGGAVFAIAVAGSAVYVGGNFATVDLTLGVNNGMVARGVARWNGAEWAALGSGNNTSEWGVSGIGYAVHAIAVSGPAVYVGGDFTSAGAVPARGVARWDAKGWSSLAGGVSGGLFADVTGIAATGTDVYVVGSFTSAGGTPCANIARWDGVSWQALGSGVGDDFYSASAVAADAGNVYASGNFDMAGGKPSQGFARYRLPVSTEAPPLRAERSGGVILVSWPSSAVGFALQSRTNLAGTGGWTPVDAAPVLANELIRVTNAIIGERVFFRLSQ